MLFHPDYMKFRAWDITCEFLTEQGICGLILDIDNTLTTHDNPKQATQVTDWLDKIKKAGIGLIIISNNSDQRVTPFANMLGLPCVCNAKKPLPGGYKKAVEQLKLKKEQVAMVGDQIFTDILGGNVAGVKTILTEPIDTKTELRQIKIKRKFENLLVRRKY